MSYAWVYFYRSYNVIDPPTCGACCLGSLLAKISVLRGNTTCASKFLEPSFFHECPPYLPICGIYLPFQVNLHVPNSTPSNNNLFCMPESLMQQLGVVSIFHARWAILTMSGLLSSFTRKWPITGMPSPMLKPNQNNCKQNSPRIVVSWTAPIVLGQPQIDVCWWWGSINFTILFGNRL